MANKKSSKAINITLWIAQVLLSAMFLMAGTMKSTQPIEKLTHMIPWTTAVPLALVRFIGIAELLGGIGLILPAMLRIKPTFTVWAAVGIATMMIFAMGFHISRGESAVIGMNLVPALLASFVAWGRIRKAPILPK